MAVDDHGHEAYESPLTKITGAVLLAVGALVLVACLLYTLWWLWRYWAP